MASDQLLALGEFLYLHQHITYAHPTSPNYATLREIYCLDNKDDPLAIVRPRSAADVALLVKFAKSAGMKFVIRAGGHNIFGLSQVKDALTIDMRDIKYVHVQEGNKSAKLGGGILQQDVQQELENHGLVAATGAIGSVGYVGWSSYGGYGPFSAQYGLGVDQILGAKIVNPDGDIVDADETLLKGIRGAGGIFGVIVELTIKILTGSLFFNMGSIGTTFQRFNVAYQDFSNRGIPPQLSLQQIVVNGPHGKVLMVAFTWSSEGFETGRQWLAKVEALGNVVMNTIEETTVPAWMKSMEQFIQPAVHGSSRTHSLRQLTPEVTAILGTSLEEMPSDPATMVSIHELRGPSTNPNESSVFGTRAPHFMIEILGVSFLEENRQASLDWANKTHKTLMQTDPENILPGIYISLDPPGLSPGEMPLSKIFGKNAREVVLLKDKYDGANVFALAVPRLELYL